MQDICCTLILDGVRKTLDQRLIFPNHLTFATQTNGCVERNGHTLSHGGALICYGIALLARAPL